jgi:hypothetical protein
MYPCGWMDGVMIALGGRHGDRGCIASPAAGRTARGLTCLRVREFPDWCPTLLGAMHIRTNKDSTCVLAAWCKFTFPTALSLFARRAPTAE